MIRKDLLLCIAVFAATSSYAATTAGFSYTELSSAIREGNTALIEQRFKEGLDPEGVGIDPTYAANQPSLFEQALRKGDLAIVGLFLAEGKSPDTIDDWLEETPLYLSTQLGNEPLTKLLLENGADPLKPARHDEKDIGQLFAKAIHDRNNVFLVLCLDHGVSVNGPYASVEGDSFVNISIRESNIGAMRLFIDHGADITVANMLNGFKTTLAIAVDMHGMESEYAKLLRSKGADSIRYVYDSPYKGHSIVDGLRTRRAPAIAAEVTGKLANGEQVEMLEVSAYSDRIDNIRSPWVRIRTKKNEGWVFGGYLAPTSTPGLD